MGNRDSGKESRRPFADALEQWFSKHLQILELPKSFLEVCDIKTILM